MFGTYTHHSSDAAVRAARSGRRKVFPNSMVAHVWAQQTQAEGRSNNGNFYFQGETPFSYGAHYVVAHFTDAYLRGQRVVLMNDHGYSISTQGHRSAARSALRGLDVVTFDVTHPSADRHEGNLATMVNAIKASALRLAKPHARAYLSGHDDTEANRIKAITLGDIPDYCEAFGIPLPALDIEALRDNVRKAYALYNDPKRAAKRAKATAQRELKHASKLTRYHAWLEGVLPTCPSLDGVPNARWLKYRTPLWQDRARIAERRRLYTTITPREWLAGKGRADALRHPWNAPTLVRKVGERLETSRGVQVPFQQALIVFLKAQSCRKRGIEWHRNGERLPVGMFELDGVDAQGNIKAGCHDITFDEMLRLAVETAPECVKATYPVPACVAG